MGLDALAARARDLQKTLDQMATGLAVNAHNISWCAGVQASMSELMSFHQVAWMWVAATAPSMCAVGTSETPTNAPCD